MSFDRAHRTAYFRGNSLDKNWLSCNQIRWSIFVGEQGVPPVLEVDARDFLPSTIQVIIFDNDDKPVATARLLEESNNVYHIGRVAVIESARGKGFGKKIVDAAIEIVRQNTSNKVDKEPGLTARVLLDSQVHALGFYEKSGFFITSKPEFLDAGILHREMEKVVYST